MSDLATAAQSAARNVAASRLLVLRSARSTTPSSARLFARAPGYVGHELMVPNVGDYYALAGARQRAGARAQRRAASSSCRTSAATGRRSCCNGPRQRAEHRLPDPPLDLRPEGRAARRAALRRQAVPATSAARRCRTGTACCSTARATSRATSRRSACSTFDFSGYVLDRVEMHECNYNWKTFIEVYLEDYHVGPFHPGPRPVRHLRRPEVGVRRLVLGADGRRQQRPREARARATYERWHKAVLDYYRGETPPHGAIWLTYYPNIMVEWYPHVLVDQHAHPARRRPARPTSSSSTIPRRSRCSSASSSRPSRRRTSRPRARTTRSPSAWTPGAARSTRRAAARSGRTSRRWKTACSTSTSSSAASSTPHLAPR